MDKLSEDEIRQSVRSSYAKVAQADNHGTEFGIAESCCGVSSDIIKLESERLGYSEQEQKIAPKGADMGLGCGNPQVIANIKKNETVLDLGSGGGFDCFLAAKQLGGTGKVIGVDMTPEMISKARSNAAKSSFNNVEFRLGEIEHLPVADSTINVIISNCVINLSPNKSLVFKEAFRVLKPGGRLAISDIVASVELPEEIRTDSVLYSGCMAGASVVDDLIVDLSSAGFIDIRITPKDKSAEFIKDWAPGKNIQDYVLSATIQAIKP